MEMYVVDAFAERLFEGNPAAVCVLEAWLPDDLMRNIAVENNLSETAFTVREGDSYRLRWFTPGGEIDLCGHATLATAFVLATVVEPQTDRFTFQTLGGELVVQRSGQHFELDFPAYRLEPTAVTDAMALALGVRPLEAWLARDLVCVLENEAQVVDCVPDQAALRDLEGLCLHITARGSDFDCVSRTFAPKLNVSEDPVCGSGHCHLVPLWSKKLGKSRLVARQASPRGGTLYCEDCGDRVKLAGSAVLYAKSELYM
ncbi:MAG: PhzF family phenazine biosynthesis protein [Clostridiales bacterium]|nr:PhzF family phenazine biosynthesis protein [Clostridiales bacterium]